MRTTVEISDEQRARLLALAARRGEKGFSARVRDAIDAYLARERERERRVAAALAAKGALSDREARALRDSIAELRSRWR